MKAELVNLIAVSLQPLADEIDSMLKHLSGGERVPFFLFVSTNKVAQYVSNMERAQTIEVMKELQERWAKGAADIPAHYNPNLKPSDKEP